MTEFIESLPGPNRTSSRRLRQNAQRKATADLWAHAEELKAHPRMWSPYPRKITKATAGRIAERINENIVAAYSTRNGFQAASRAGVCYIQYDPDRLDTDKLAFEKGVAYGRSLVMREVAAALWDLRTAFANIEGWQDEHGRTTHHIDTLPGRKDK
jgi:hypothetical protein